MDVSAETIRAGLLASAQAHRAADQREREHQLAMIDWLSGSAVASAAAGASPFDRNVFDPGHATGSCFVVSDDAHAALIFHKNLELWVQPGGHGEPGESDPRLVAAREAEEELGITLGDAVPELFDLDVHRIAARGEAPTHLHFDFRSLVVIERCELAPASDAASAEWLTRSGIAAIGVDVGVRRMADKALARGLLAP